MWEDNVPYMLVFGGKLTKQVTGILHFQHQYECNLKKNQMVMNLSYFNILLIKLLNMHKEIKKNKNEYAEKHTTNNLWPIFDYTILFTEEFILLSNRSE